MSYFNPHSFRSTLVMLGETVCQSAEEFKAWSQNLGHDAVLTTFNSYGQVATGRQAEILRNIGRPRQVQRPDITEFAKAVAREMRSMER